MNAIQRATKEPLGALVGSSSVELIEGGDVDFEMLSLDKAWCFLAEKHI